MCELEEISFPVTGLLVPALMIRYGKKKKGGGIKKEKNILLNNRRKCLKCGLTPHIQRLSYCLSKKNTFNWIETWILRLIYKCLSHGQELAKWISLSRLKKNIQMDLMSFRIFSADLEINTFPADGSCAL